MDDQRSHTSCACCRPCVTIPSADPHRSAQSTVTSYVFLLSHMTVHHHHLHHLHYHHLHLLLLAQSFILNLRLGVSANHFLHRPFSIPTGLILQTLGPFNVFILLNGWICLHGVLDYKPALSRFSNALKIIALSFHFIIIHVMFLALFTPNVITVTLLTNFS